MAGAGKSKENIVSQALIYIGEAPISSFSEGVAGQVASTIYDNARDSLLSSTRWRFSAGKTQLSQLADSPRNEWRYGYQLPTDLLLMIRTYPGSKYEIFEDKLYTNHSSVEIDYLFRPNEPEFPAYFVEALAYDLAAKFAMSITNNLSIAELMEAKAAKALTDARFKESQARPNVAIQSRPWIEVRR